MEEDVEDPMAQVACDADMEMPAKKKQKKANCPAAAETIASIEAPGVPKAADPTNAKGNPLHKEQRRQ